MDDDEEEEDYEYGSDADEYNYSDEDGEQGNDELIEIENVFYEADDCRTEDPARAVEMFEKVVALESERGQEVKWRFKALEHLVVLHCRLGDAAAMVAKYKEMLSYSSAVTRNECGDSVNAVLEAIAAAAEVGNGAPAPPTGSASTDVLATMYDVTIDALKAANNERLWFNTNVKVGKVYLQRGDLERVSSIVDELRAACRLPDGTDDDISKGSSLLEVYALEIQLCAALGDSDRLKRIYPKTLNLTAAVADPRIMGVIREEGGKMYMRDASWRDAYNEFYEGFRAYQEAGNARAKDCLKYVVLANMLASSDINPFDAREAKAYQEEPEITAMKRLRLAYDANDLHAFERALSSDGASSAGGKAPFRKLPQPVVAASPSAGLMKAPKARILDDPFVMSYVDPLRRKMREHVILNLVKPYNRVTLDFIATQLNLETDQVHSILVDMILDDRVRGAIDRVKGHLYLDDDADEGSGDAAAAGGATKGGGAASAAGAGAKGGGTPGFSAADEARWYEALEKWADALDQLGLAAAARLQ